LPAKAAIPQADEQGRIAPAPPPLVEEVVLQVCVLP
jgi:hypothetical protein